MRNWSDGGYCTVRKIYGRRPASQTISVLDAVGQGSW